MSGSANNGTYGNPGQAEFALGTGLGPGDQPGWGYWRGWTPPSRCGSRRCARVHLLVAGRPRPCCSSVYGANAWDTGDAAATAAGRAAGSAHWQGGRPAVGRLEEFWCGGGAAARPPSSGNRAFDEYRAETLRRLEEEQKEFAALPRPAALRQGQGRVRPVHGRAPQPSAGASGAAAGAARLRPSTPTISAARRGHLVPAFAVLGKDQEDARGRRQLSGIGLPLPSL